MDKPSFVEEVGADLVRRAAAEATVVGPALLGTLLLGPVGFLLGVACTVGIIAAAEETSDPPA